MGMKQTSKYFDSIRIKPKGDAESVKPEVQMCQWKGCPNEGAHRAPMGRGQEGRFYLFCGDHIKQYNASYNYFAGMSDKAVSDFQKDALTGHRPTWKTGANAWAHGTRSGARSSDPGALGGMNGKANDPHGFFAWRAKRVAGAEEEPQRYIKPIERKSLEALHLPENATKAQIKSRFKELVKRHHPDANGGDKRSEDTLREIIQAYNYLKQSGLV
jgi:curved DNA-binding protein CbpA